MANACKILIVDDEPYIRILLSKILQQEGFQCLEAYDFHSASTMLNSLRFNLVVADIGMPGTSGVELLSFIKRKWKETTVIMMTGDLRLKNSAAQYRTMGAADFMTKPFDLRDFISSVKNNLGIESTARHMASCI